MSNLHRINTILYLLMMFFLAISTNSFAQEDSECCDCSCPVACLNSNGAQCGSHGSGGCETYDPSEAYLNSKVLLSSCYDTIADLMDNNLKYLAPLEEPYSALGFNHFGFGGCEVIEGITRDTMGMFNPANELVDWIFVEIRSSTDSTIVVATRSAILQRDGDIVDTDGWSPLTFEELEPDSFFVAIRHRNHFGIMTNEPIWISEDIPVEKLDLTLIGTPIYGLQARVELESGIMGLIPGNVNNDCYLKYTGPENDRAEVLNKIGGTNPTAFLLGYYKEDCNMNGKVSYTGPDNDRATILYFLGGNVPTTVLTEQLPK